LKFKIRLAAATSTRSVAYFRHVKTVARCEAAQRLSYEINVGKVKTLVDAGVARVQVMEQLGISKASFYRYLQQS
jgi:predicted transcriptional regulator YheO